MFWPFKRGGELSPGLHKITHPLRLRRINSRGPTSYHGGDTAFAWGSHKTRLYTSSVCGETPRMETPNNMNVEGERNAAASTSAPLTTASTSAVQGDRSPRSFDPRKLLLHLQPVLSHPFLSPSSLPHPLRPPVGVQKCCHTPWFITSPS